MKERPIIFNDEMVRAILDGRKTQTRRVIKPQPVWVYDGKIHVNTHDADQCGEIKFPHGKPGERLWVREAHAIVPRTAYAQGTGVEQVLRPNDSHDAAVFRAGWERSKPRPWKPSIHMPRWASRITLEITGVRVERVQDISEDDAVAEGVHGEREALAAGMDWYDNPRRAFRSLWQSIYGPDSWASNPWVWVIEFRRVQ